MKIEDMTIGRRVIATHGIGTLGIMPGTEGVIIEVDDFVAVAWDTPYKPLPIGWSPTQIAQMPMNHPDAPVIIRYKKWDAIGMLMDANIGKEN